MRKLVVTAALLAAMTTPGAAATLVVDVFDNGHLEGTAVSTNGSVFLRITDDPAFDVIDVNASGPPFLPGGDLSSVGFHVTSAGISTRHQLAVDVFQTGIFVDGGVRGATAESTFTANSLIGNPGPTTESTFFNGTTDTLGTLLAHHTFGVGVSNGSFGPVFVGGLPDITADAHEYLVNFSHPDQSANDTIQLTTTAGVIPETSTWAMIMLGFSGLAFGAWRRKRYGPVI